MLSTMWRRKHPFFMGSLLRPIPFFLLMIALCSYAAGEDKRVVCYYTNWSVYRPGTAKFSPQNINPYLCTHLIYAFGGLDKDNGLRPYDKYQDIEQGGYAKFTGLKTYNKNLKTMLAIGGWNEGSARFSPLVADEERRREFVKNVVKFLRQNHFDGLDLDWEYPAFRDGGKPRDRDNYAQLVQELREEFERESSKTGRTRLLLTMAVPAGIEYIDKGYDIPKLNRYLDFMNILSYDYHSAFEPAVNHHSPLFSLQEDDEYNFDAELSIDYTIKHYLKLGADRDKLVLGIPTYGRSYTLFNPESTDLGSPADGPGEQGEATREKGYLAYYEICQSLNSEKDWKIEQPKLGAMGPYAYKDKQWVGYDDAFIVKEKAKYVNDKNLGGIMFWSIDNDDFRGKCHDRPYPLIEAGKEMLFGKSGKSSSNSKNNIASSSQQTETKTARPSNPLRRPGQKSSKPKSSLRTTTAAVSTRQTTTANPLTTPEPPTTPDPGSDFVCKDEGFFPHPRDCKKYFWCLDSGPSNLGIVAHQFTCPSGLFFNKAADSCDFARNVLCKDKRDKATTTTTSKPTTSTTQQSTTSSSRLKFTAATAKSTGNRYTTTTTTTTEPPPEEEEEEEEVEDDYHAEEDPQTIKQLITLIKKLGGVAELEKQLEHNGGSVVTNSPISKTLYNKVLTPGKFQSPYRNGPSGPQNEGLPSPSPGQDDSPYSRREKPQYVTIRRERPSTDQPVSEESNSRGGGSEREDADDEQEDGVEVEAERERPIKPIYSTIQRRRPSTTESASSESTSPSTAVTKAKYSSIQRSRPSTIASDSADTTTSRYVTLQRHRPQQLDTEEEVAEDERVSPLPFVRSRPRRHRRRRRRRPSSDVNNHPKTCKKEHKDPYSSCATSGSSYRSTSTEEPPTTTRENFTSRRYSNKYRQKDTPTTTSRLDSSASQQSDSVMLPTRTRSRFSTRNNSSAESTLSNDSPVTDSSDEALKLNELTSTRPRSRFAIARSRGTTTTTSTINPPTRHVFGRGRSRATTVKPEEPTSEGLSDDNKSSENTSRQKANNVPYYVPIQRTSNNQYLIHHEATRNDSSEILIQMENTNVLTKSKNETRSKEDVKSSVENSGEVLDSSSESVAVNSTDSNVVLDESTEKVEDSIGSASGNSQEVSKSSQNVITEVPVETTTVVNNPPVITTTTTEVLLVNTTSNVTDNVEKTGNDTTSKLKKQRRDNVEETANNSTSKFKKQRGRAKFSINDSEEDQSKSIEVEDTLSREKENSGERSRVRNTSREKSKVDDSSREKSRVDDTSRERSLNSGERRRVNNTSRERGLNSRERGEVNVTSRERNLKNAEKSNSKESSGEEELASKSKFNVENFDRHKSSAKSRDISQSDHDDKVFLESVDDSGLRKRKKVVRLLPRNRNVTNETTNINDNSGKRKVTVVRPRNSVGRNSVGKENEFEVKTEQPSSSTVRNFQRTSVRNPNRNEVSRNPEDDFPRVKNDESTLRNSVSRTRNFNRYEVPSNFDEEFLRVTPDESFTTVRNSVQRTPATRNSNRNKSRSSVGRDDVSNSNIDEPVRNSFQRSRNSNRNNYVETRNSLSREDGNSERTNEGSTVRNSFQTRNRNGEGRGTNRGRFDKKDGTTLAPESSSRGRIRFRIEDDGSSLVNDNTFDDVYDENGLVIKKNKPRLSEETGVRFEEDLGENYRKVVVRNRVIHDRSNSDVRSRSRLNREDLETDQSGRVSKKVDDNLSYENSLNGVGKKRVIIRNRGSIRAKESLKDEVEGVDYDGEEGEGEEEGREGQRERATNTENEIPVETESDKENTRIRIVPVRRVVARNRSTSTEEPPTTTRENFTSRRYSNKYRQKDTPTTTSRLDSSASQQSDSDDVAVTTSRPRKFTFPKRLARPSTTLETPIAEQLQKTTEKPFDSQEYNTADLPDLADVGVVAIQALATVPPSNFEPAAFSTPSPLFPRRTSTVQTLIRHTIPVTSVGTDTSPRAQVTAVSSSTLRTTPALIQSVTRGVPRPFSKKRPTTLAPPPKPAYITKGRTKQVQDIPDYEVDYYAEPVDVPLSGKVRIHNDGYIECLDVGNFPHPFSCRKFISCAKMETEHLLGWEYTCPRGLSFDPIGGICNWSAGLGCKE
uniref:chitinase n=1 Tax=Sogatella furcifera TaxID=113103 RepID=A0A7S5YHC8_SOGFU|nr:chitinase 6-1 [Sogatella furcifera]